MKYRSEIFEVVHQSATEKFEIGAISEEKMREYDKMCLAPETGVSEEFDAVRKTEKTERAGFVTV